MRRAMILLWLALSLSLSLPASTALAQSGGPYDLTWNSVDGGGGSVSGDGYTLDATIGQPDAAVWAGSDGYTLAGGFWSGGAAGYRIHLPLVLRNF